jgi:hypothetical protein
MVKRKTKKTFVAEKACDNPWHDLHRKKGKEKIRGNSCNSWQKRKSRSRHELHELTRIKKTETKKTFVARERSGKPTAH